MIKSLALLKRKKDITREQFLHHWEKVHAPLVLSSSLPGVRKYVQHHPVEVDDPVFENDIDGIAEMWFDDIESLKGFYTWLNSAPEAQELRDDSDYYVNMEHLPVTFVSEEHVMKE